MEQNVRNLGVVFATLALIASVLVIPSVSAEGELDGDLVATFSGDNGLTSYASAYGHAHFTGEISSATGAAHDDVTVTASFAEDSGWLGDQANMSDCSGSDDEGTYMSGVFNTGALSEEGTISFCISVSVAESGSVIGDDAYMTLNVTSNGDTLGHATELRIAVSDWRVSSNDGVKDYSENETHTYTLTVDNIKMVQPEEDSPAEPAALDEPVFISLSNAGEGWNIDSENTAWDKMELKATIEYIAAGQSFDLELDIQLVGGIVPATSYIGSNSNIVFTGNDAAGVYQLVTLEANVADNFALNTVGAGNEYVDNGCSDAVASIAWTPTIKNFGNTVDSFEVTFDTSNADTANWDVDGATGFNTGNLLPKFEGGTHSFNVGLHVPGGLAAGTSHSFSMTITSDNDVSVTQTQTFSATVNQCFGLTLALDGENTGSADPGSTVDFSATVTNTGNGEDTIEFQTMGASEWAPTLSESSSTLASGASSQVVFSLTVPSDASSTAQSGMAMVHAYSEACGEDKMDCEYEADVSVAVSANHVYDITAGYYTNESGIEMSAADVDVGMSVQMKFVVTNNGNGPDEVTLALAEGAPSWVTLGQNSDEALIGPGQTSQALTVDIAPPSGTELGDYTFQVVATSADGTTTSTTDDLTVTVNEKSTSSGPETDKVEEDDSPGFGILSVVAALGAVLLLRRRS